MIAGCLLSGSLAAGVLSVAAQPRAGDGLDAVCQALGIPGYFYPGPEWDRVTASEPVRYVIMDPANGPGKALDPNYVRRVAQAKEAGARVLGYVHTSYAKRSRAAVLEDLRRYRDWYGVTDVFLDEVPTSRAELAWYRSISDEARAVPDAVVALNPGTVPDEAYLSVGDVVVVFEGTYGGYRSAVMPEWIDRYSPARFWHLVYGTPERALTAVLARSRTLRAGTIYVTDGSGANPWNTLPTYWSRQVDQVETTNPAGCATSHRG